MIMAKAIYLTKNSIREGKKKNQNKAAVFHKLKLALIDLLNWRLYVMNH